MTRRPGLTAEAIAAEVERLFAVYPPRDDDHAFHRRYLRNCVRSGVEPYRVSERARQHIADVLARLDARREAESDDDNQTEGDTT